MTRRRITAAILGALIAWASPGASARAASGPHENANGVEQYHYTMTARVRPLVLFWISRSGVGDAVVTRRRAPGEMDYSLLIGSDPERAPRRINRWGYIDEEIRGEEARLIGLMTQSDEASIEEAEASVGRQSRGNRTFKVIQATVDGDEARSIVTSIAAPESYSFRQVRTVLDLAQREGTEGKPRVVRLPAGTRPGFLSALAELMDRNLDHGRPGGRTGPDRVPVKFVYHGRIYDLRATRAHLVPTLRAGGAAYEHVAVADFEIRSATDGEVTQFSMTYGTKGALAGVPLTVSFQPRWWMEIDLAIDSGTGLGALEP